MANANYTKVTLDVFMPVIYESWINLNRLEFNLRDSSFYAHEFSRLDGYLLAALGVFSFCKDFNSFEDVLFLLDFFRFRFFYVGGA
jgi:hypothetical protein